MVYKAQCAAVFKQGEGTKAAKADNDDVRTRTWMWLRDHLSEILTVSVGMVYASGTASLKNHLTFHSTFSIEVNVCVM